MNRRNAIGNIVLLSIGTVVSPSCGQNDEPVLKLKNLSLNKNEERMLAQLADVIIPKTNFIGAADLKAHEFTLMMLDDCYDRERQKRFTDGIREFDKLVKNKYGNPFTSCTSGQKKDWLTAIETKKNISDEVIFFYETTKRHTVQAFTSSREYMTGVVKYNLVPGGNFRGCVPVNKT